MRADLHTHTVWSDGALQPSGLMQRAAERGLSHLAICDHDTIGAYDSIRADEIPDGLTLVPGVEISTVLECGEVHMLGLGVDTANKRLRRTIANLLEHRRRRLGEMLDRLLRIGCFQSLDEAGHAALRDRLLQRPDVCDAPHVQRHDGVGASACRLTLVHAMIEHGVVQTLPEAFDRYLAEKRPAYVPYYRYAADEAVAMIHEAGGLAVLAHPGTYRGRTEAAIRQAHAAGADGVEVMHPKHDRSTSARVEKLGRELGMRAFTGGSDFHNVESRHAWQFGQSVAPEDGLPALFAAMRCPRFTGRHTEEAG